MELFNFDLSESILKIRLGMIYEPAILKNSIKKRPYNCFLYVLHGTYVYNFKNGSLYAPAESLIYLPRGFDNYEYTVLHEDSSRAKTMQVEFSVIDANTKEELAFSPTPKLIEQRLPQIKEAMTNLISLYASKNFCERHMAYSELMKIIFYVSSDAVTEDDSPKKSILPAIKYIEQNYTLKIPTEKLAKLCMLSQSQLRRCFKSAMGLSPKAYQSELLFNAAKNLLKLGEFSVSEVSEMLGFYDLYAFSHFFTKHSGFSPRKFAAQQKNTRSSV